MPLYDYKCSQCRIVFEVKHPMTFSDAITCPECASEETQKLISVPASVLDWQQSDSVHNSTRYRPPVVNRLVAGRQSGG